MIIKDKLIINELGGSPIRSDNVYLANKFIDTCRT